MSTITEPDQWLGVEVRHFAALDAVAREGSFGRAADRLGYTQSAVSQQIATLEKIVGETLVERPGGPRAVSLTEAGRLVLRHAEAIVARLEAAKADISALRAGETGTLRVGTYQSVGARVLPGVMRRFMADWPGIELGLSEPATDPELYGLIESGEVDLAFCSPPLPEGPFEALELMSDPYVLLVPADSPLARRKSASLDDLGDHVLIGSSTCASGGVVESALRKEGFDLELCVPLGRQRHCPGPRGRRLRRRPRPSARGRRARRRPRARPSPASRRCHAAPSPCSGTATGTARLPPARSSRSRERSSADVEREPRRALAAAAKADAAIRGARSLRRSPGPARCTSRRSRTAPRAGRARPSNVAVIRAPVAPSGCPSEMPLPFGFTSPACQRSCSPVSFRNCRTTHAKASLTSITAMSSQVSPAFRARARMRAGCRGASGTDRHRRGRTRRTVHVARARASTHRPRSPRASPRRRRRSRSSCRR